MSGFFSFHDSWLMNHEQVVEQLSNRAAETKLHCKAWNLRDCKAWNLSGQGSNNIRGLV